MTIDGGAKGSVLRWKGEVVRRVTGQIRELKRLALPGTTGAVWTWTEVDAAGSRLPHYAISVDGQSIDRIAAAQERLALRYGSIDPLVPPKDLPTGWRSGPGNEMFIVQLRSQPMDEFTQAIRDAGGKVYNFLPESAYVCRLPGAVLGAVRSLPFVRAVMPLEPALRIDPALLSAWRENRLPTQKYMIQSCGDDAALKQEAAMIIDLMGGRIEDCPPEGTLMIAELSPQQLAMAASVNGVLWIDKWSEPQVDMNHVRTVNGGSYLETNTPYQGAGVIAHAIDTGVRQTHNALAGRITLRSNTGDTGHGTCVAGIVTGNGAGNANGKGMMPLGNLVFSRMTSGWSTASRLAWTQDTVNTFNCVLETNSWGDDLTGQYTSISSGMDEIIFKTDLLILNSMSNWGNNQQVRPQAWAKNIVAVGAVNHFNDANLSNDRWQGTGSTGPAADGRIKPELCFWYDSIECPSSNSDSSYTTGFGGTSAATPISAGCFGLFFEMWSDGAFFNSALGKSVFENRTKSTTAKAFLINTAVPYSNNGSLPYFDISRNVQGWGLPNVRNLYDRRQSFFFDNENTVLTNQQRATYRFIVPAGTPEFRATMVYLDPWAAPNANPTRINDLDLKVTSPTGVVYQGNNGMTTSVWTAPGGSPDSRNTVENVFVNNPLPGIWTVEVRCALLAQDARVETNGVNDVDFALVVSGVRTFAPSASMTVISGNLVGGSSVDLLTSNNQRVQLTSTSGGIGLPEAVLEIKSAAFPNQPVNSSIRVESRAASSGVQLAVEALDHVQGAWVRIGSGSVAASDTVLKLNLPSTARFLGADRTMTLRCRWWRDSAGSEISGEVDQVAWDITPGKPNLGKASP
jgi:hypothetical protein